MFKLSENYDVNRNISKPNFIRISPSEISTINNPISKIHKSIPRRDSVCGLKGSLLRLIADVLHAATNNRHIDGDDIRLVNEGPYALFLNFRLVKQWKTHRRN